MDARSERTLAEWLGSHPAPGPPPRYKPESTTVWSFPERGAWASHRGDYPGNWSPYVPRNLILRYTKPGEVVLDPMMGSGTTLVECALLRRRGIGIDIHAEAVGMARDRIRAFHDGSSLATHVGDARDLTMVPEGSVDLVALHPPYASIIHYGSQHMDGDLSRMRGFEGFLRGLGQVALECHRVLRADKHCAVMLGDTRQRRHYIPLAYLGMTEFLRAGFVLKEDIVKLQWNMRGTFQSWMGTRDFYRIAHEHIFVFRKPLGHDDVQQHGWSTIRGTLPRCREWAPFACIA